MKLITQDELMALLSYNPVTGVFRWNVARGSVQVGYVAGAARKDGRWKIGIAGVKYYASRLAWLYVHGCWPVEIDHKNNDKTDDRLSNLRDVSRKVNQQNLRGPTRGNKSGMLGVSKTDFGKFHARIQVDKKCFHLGNFDTAEEAHSAYLSAKRRLHEGCTL